MHDLIPLRLNDQAPLYKAREILMLGLRHYRLMTITFAGVFLGALLGTLFLPRHFVANTKILVKHERKDPPVSADSAETHQVSEGVTDAEINSEVEIIKSADLLERIVLACGLQRSSVHFWPTPWHWNSDSQGALAAAVRTLSSNLKVEALPKTNLISITYGAKDPQTAARVLHALVDLYMEKHLAVHQPAGTFEFFQKQAQQYENGLSQAESRLVGFRRAEGVVSPGEEKIAALQKIAEFRAELKKTQAAIAEIQQRKQVLETQVRMTPARTTTESRLSDNPQLMGQLKSTLLNLELKRTELLQKYEPTYRLVTEVDTQIKQTRAAIEEAAKSQLREETIDRNPTFAWVDSELAKTRSELAAQQARAAVLKNTVDSYEQQAAKLGRQEVFEQDLERERKTQEESYLLYQRKREEARISNALDRSRILNVSVAEPAIVPVLPSRSRTFTVFIGLFAAIAMSLAAATAAEYLNPSLKRPIEVVEFLDLPVLASISSRVN